MNDPVTALESLKRLRERGLITEAEYEQRRSGVLAGVGGSEPVLPATQTGAHQSMAAGLYDIETLRVKLIVGRLVGIAIGLAIWWFVLGPMFGTENPIATIISLFVVVLAGLWIGQMVTLSIVRGSSR